MSRLWKGQGNRSRPVALPPHTVKQRGLLKRNASEILTYKVSLIYAKKVNSPNQGDRHLEIGKKVLPIKGVIPGWNSDGVNVRSKSLKINTKLNHPARIREIQAELTVLHLVYS